MGCDLKRISVVEDDRDISSIIQLALEEVGGFELQLCNSGAEAIEKVPDFDPDIIILDFMMPDMNGSETLASLKKIPSIANTPVIFMTARVQTRDVEEYQSLGIAGIIAKPFDPMSLADEVRQIWISAKSKGLD
jgi:CheY-like chemotaxis protein